MSMGKKKPTSALSDVRNLVRRVRKMEHASWYAVGIVGDVFVTTASHRYSEMAATNRLDVQNTGPAFSRRILSNSSESVFPRTTATFCRSPGFFASLHNARNTRKASVSRSLPSSPSPSVAPRARADPGVFASSRARPAPAVAVSSLSNSSSVTSCFANPGEISKMSSSDAPTATAMLVMSELTLLMNPWT